MPLSYIIIITCARLLTFAILHRYATPRPNSIAHFYGLKNVVYMARVGTSFPSEVNKHTEPIFKVKQEELLNHRRPFYSTAFHLQPLSTPAIYLSFISSAFCIQFSQL